MFRLTKRETMAFILQRQTAFFVKIILILIVTVFIIQSSFLQAQKSDCAWSYYRHLPPLATRNDFVEILRSNKLQTAAEVGVQQGRYAEYLLNNWPECRKYHAIDLWKYQTHYSDKANVIDEQQDQNYDTTRQRLQKWRKIVQYHRNYSIFAVNDIDDNSLDFIYIDARHDYNGVYEDLKLYWPKLKCGGIFAGHDFLDAHEVSGQDWAVDQNGVRRTDGKAVKSAVIEFAAKKNRRVLYTLSDPWPSWYLRK